MKKKRHKPILIITILYAILIAYFLFFGAGRPEVAANTSVYQFNIIPHLVSFNISDFRYFPHGFFELGNFVGFIPFGILIPLLYRCTFLKCIALFFCSILIVETLQMFTFLGSFDINDAIINTLGVAVGFCAYTIGSRFKDIRKSIIVSVLCAIILSIGVIAFSNVLNTSLTQQEGPMIALHELEGDQAHLIHNNLQSFEIGDETITPTINFYSSDDDTIKTLTYVFDGKDIVLSLYYGVPNQAHDDDGEIIVAVNGKEIEFYADNHYGTYGSSQIFIHKTNELTFIIKGNINLWDVSFKEMRYWWQ